MKTVEKILVHTCVLAIINWVIVLLLAALEKDFVIYIVVGIMNYIYLNWAARKKIIQCIMYIITTICADIFAGYLVLSVYEKMFNEEGVFSILYLFIHMMVGIGVALLLLIGDKIIRLIIKIIKGDENIRNT